MSKIGPGDTLSTMPFQSQEPDNGDISRRDFLRQGIGSLFALARKSNLSLLPDALVALERVAPAAALTNPLAARVAWLVTKEGVENVARLGKFADYMEWLSHCLNSPHVPFDAPQIRAQAGSYLNSGVFGGIGILRESKGEWLPSNADLTSVLGFVLPEAQAFPEISKHAWHSWMIRADSYREIKAEVILPQLLARPLNDAELGKCAELNQLRNTRWDEVRELFSERKDLDLDQLLLRLSNFVLHLSKVYQSPADLASGLSQIGPETWSANYLANPLATARLPYFENLKRLARASHYLVEPSLRRMAVGNGEDPSEIFERELQTLSGHGVNPLAGSEELHTELKRASSAAVTERNSIVLFCDKLSALSTVAEITLEFWSHSTDLCGIISLFPQDKQLMIPNELTKNLADLMFAEQGDWPSDAPVVALQIKRGSSSEDIRSQLMSRSESQRRR